MVTSAQYLAFEILLSMEGSIQTPNFCNQKKKRFIFFIVIHKINLSYPKITKVTHFLKDITTITASKGKIYFFSFFSFFL